MSSPLSTVWEPARPSDSAVLKNIIIWIVEGDMILLLLKDCMIRPDTLKPATLAALGDYLKNDYMVVSLDFQMLGNADFSTEIVFARAFVRYLLRTIRNKRKPIYLYNLFLSEEEVSSAVYATAVADKYQFVKGGHLDHRLSIN